MNSSAFVQRLSTYEIESCLPENETFWNLYEELSASYYRKLADIIYDIKLTNNDHAVSVIANKLFSEGINWCNIVMFILYSEKLMEMYPSSDHELRAEIYLRKHLLKWMVDHPLEEDQYLPSPDIWLKVGCMYILCFSLLLLSLYIL
jgi:hypothetical protein